MRRWIIGACLVLFMLAEAGEGGLATVANFPLRVFHVNKRYGDFTADEWSIVTTYADRAIGFDDHGYTFPGAVDNFVTDTSDAIPIYPFITSMGMQRNSNPPSGDNRYKPLDRDETNFLHSADPAGLVVTIISNETRLWWVRDYREINSANYTAIGVDSYIVESADTKTGTYTQQGTAITEDGSIWYSATVSSSDTSKWYRVRSKLSDEGSYTAYSWSHQPDTATTGIAYVKTINGGADFVVGVWGDDGGPASDMKFQFGNLNSSHQQQWGYESSGDTLTGPTNGISEYSGDIATSPSGNTWVMRATDSTQSIESMWIDWGYRNNRFISNYGEYLFKPDSTDFRNSHDGRMDDIETQNGDGVYLDFVVDSWLNWYVATTPQGEDSAYQSIESYVLAMLQYLRTQHPNLVFLCNGIASTNPSTWSGIFDYVPPCNAIAGEFLGWSGPSQSDPFRDSDMLNGAIETAHVEGLEFPAYSYSDIDDYAARNTSIARYWLVFREGLTYYQYMTTNYGQDATYVPELDIDMGRPLDPVLTGISDLVDGTNPNLYSREFERGIAYYNPTGSAETATFGSNYYVVSFTGGKSPKHSGGDGAVVFTGPTGSTSVGAKRGVIVTKVPYLGR